jgi:hypothetical protein
VFYYLGRKARVAPKLPKPRYDTIIEPFAGSMAYSLHWQPDRAIGIELDERVVAIWNRLAGWDAKRLRSYRVPDVGERFTDPWMKLSDPGNCALNSSYRVMSKMMHERAWTLKRQAIRHHRWARDHVWYLHGDYRQAPDWECTWFIDPPYQGVDNGYDSGLDYDELGDWCRTRRGQVIVCESANATWLPFDAMTVQVGQPANGTSNLFTAEGVFVRN